MTSVKVRIETILQESFTPERLEVVNESHQHAGHKPEFDGRGETHMRVRIQAEGFAGMSRLQRHRAINDALKPVLDDGLHALAIEASAPGEPARW